MEQPTAIAICQLIADSGKHVAARLADATGASRQATSAWLARLREEGVIRSEGVGRGTTYQLVDVVDKRLVYRREGLSEDVVWREIGGPVVADLADNVRAIWHHGITEMVNNAIEHSASDIVEVSMTRNVLRAECWISDAGEGIFLKIQRALDLYDPREAILELAKGKLTTDPAHHSGEGIFFSSKMFDRFVIRSGELSFVHLSKEGADVMLMRDAHAAGTSVYMGLDNDSPRTAREVFDTFAMPDEFTFAKTIVPVRLAQHEGESLISRSQAKRLTKRFERFQTVILDFAGVTEIGQGFADEVFRVFANAHPQVTLQPTGLAPAVHAMIKRVQTAT
jgi:DNA-binding transcriptional ArsR family regulator